MTRNNYPTFIPLLTVVFTLLFAGNAHAQSAELNSLAATLAQSVSAVQSGARSYEQSITFSEPAVVKYSYVEADSKGNRTNYAFEFNLADIDPYAVREQTQKDVISVTVVARSKQKLIKSYKNDVVQSYQSQINILASDIDNGRKLAETIKAAIPLAEKVMQQRLQLSGYPTMVDWLVNNVKTVELGDKTITQSLAKADHVGALTFTRVEKDAKSSTEEVYTVNLADINPNAVLYKISGNQFAISIETMQKSRYIGLRKDGQQRPYTNGFIIATNNADEARDLRQVLESAIPLAVKEVKAAMPTVSSDTDGLQKLTALTGNVTSGDTEIIQTLDGPCLASFTQTEKTPKSGTKHAYTFNWMDFNALASSIEVSGDKIYIDVQSVDGRKLFMHTIDDNFKGYENGLKLYMADIEAARRAKVLVDNVSRKCKESYKHPFPEDPKSTTAYLQSNIADQSIDDVTLKQSIEPVDDGNNKYKFTTIEVTSKGSGGEMIYEFNLSDLNPTSISTDVKGKWLYVTVETDLKGKIIKAYKDGKIQPYTSSLQFAVNEVDKARNVAAALEKAVRAAKGKL